MLSLFFSYVFNYIFSHPKYIIVSSLPWLHSECEACESLGPDTRDFIVRYAHDTQIREYVDVVKHCFYNITNTTLKYRLNYCTVMFKSHASIKIDN